MIAVLQRVRRAAVRVDDETVGAIERGLLVLLGCEAGDQEESVRALVRKTVELRVFADEEGKMNLSLEEVGGAVLVVSQFTLLGDTRKGRRPSFAHAAPPEEARRLYERFIRGVEERGIQVESGLFGARMVVEIQNDGPVTLILEHRAPEHGGDTGSA